MVKEAKDGFKKLEEKLKKSLEKTKKDLKKSNSKMEGAGGEIVDFFKRVSRSSGATLSGRLNSFFHELVASVKNLLYDSRN